MLCAVALQAEMSEDEGHSGSDSDAEDDAEGVLVRASSNTQSPGFDSHCNPTAELS